MVLLEKWYSWTTSYGKYFYDARTQTNQSLFKLFLHNTNTSLIQTVHLVKINSVANKQLCNMYVKLPAIELTGTRRWLDCFNHPLQLIKVIHLNNRVTLSRNHLKGVLIYSFANPHCNCVDMLCLIMFVEVSTQLRYRVQIHIPQFCVKYYATSLVHVYV